MTSTTSAVAPPPARRAPQWWRASLWHLHSLTYLMAWGWGIALVLVVAGLAIANQLTDVSLSAVAMSHHAFLWFPFSLAVSLPIAYLPVHLASGMTRASFIKGMLVANLAIGLLNAALQITALLLERAVYSQLGWRHAVDVESGLEVLHAGAVTYGAGLALVYTAAAVSGLLVSMMFYRMGGWWGTLAIPLTVAPIVLVLWLGVDPATQWNMWGGSPWDVQFGWALSILVIAVGAGAFAILARRVPISAKKG